MDIFQGDRWGEVEAFELLWPQDITSTSCGIINLGLALLCFPRVLKVSEDTLEWQGLKEKW